MSMRCTNCGHQSAEGSTFCLNCGSRLTGGAKEAAADKIPVSGETSSGHPGSEANRTASAEPAEPAEPAAPLSPVTDRDSLNQGGQPLQADVLCEQCGASNSSSMRFCRQCGTRLPTPSAQGRGGGGVVAARSSDSDASESRRRRTASPTPPPGAPPPGSSQPIRAAISAPSENEGEFQRCALCDGETPSGFSFCQRCGKPLTSQPSSGPSNSAGEDLGGGQGKGGGVPASRTPTPKSVPIVASEVPAWASIIAVQRDGTDGQEYPLRDDYVELGNSSSQGLRFDDPYLAISHARIERRGVGGARIVAVDRLNGVFRRIRADTSLVDGALILIGRELLRFELLSDAESKPSFLAQHGISLFGSPLLQSWGRISQILPSGGVRDVRHLYGDEMTIGREEGDVIFRDDGFLSRRHAALSWRNAGCVLSDLGSSNGTFLRITEPANLSTGDVLRLGDQMFRFKSHG